MDILIKSEFLWIMIDFIHIQNFMVSNYKAKSWCPYDRSQRIKTRVDKINKTK